MIKIKTKMEKLYQQMSVDQQPTSSLKHFPLKNKLCKTKIVRFTLWTKGFSYLYVIRYIGN